MDFDHLEQSVLGKPSEYPTVYMPSLLQAIPRATARDGMFVEQEQLPFNGVDIWNAYELSWLSPKGKPEVAIAEIRVPCSSRALIESKSLKLYINSFAETRFTNAYDVRQTMESDLSVNTKSPVEVKITSTAQASSQPSGVMPGESLDELAVDMDFSQPDPSLLSVELGRDRSEQLKTDLFRSVCPVTGQPDWATIHVAYSGQAIRHEGLLQYLVSYRRHAAFHEQCIEQIFLDIMRAAAPRSLTVYGRFLRRGGIDINPVRSTESGPFNNVRLIRQ